VARRGSARGQAGASARRRARIAEALHEYWQLAIKPFWPQIRAVLDADVAYRAIRLARGGIEALLTDLHPELELAQHAITVQSSAAGSVHDLRGAGLLLVPCVFAWPHVMVDIDAGNPASITYAPRGIGELWPQNSPAMRGDDALADLLGRTRAAVLRAVALPQVHLRPRRRTGPEHAGYQRPTHRAAACRAGVLLARRATRALSTHPARPKRSRRQQRGGENIHAASRTRVTITAAVACYGSTDPSALRPGESSRAGSVAGDDRASGRHVVVGPPQRPCRSVVRDDAFAAAQHRRVDHHPELVD
jgi:Family of unknown function (DUF5937)